MQNTRSILMKTNNNIALIGMPAVGKSTVGNLLAQSMNYEFVDSDDIIQEKEQKSLSQIISEKGLSQFLKIEESYILSIVCNNHVIATGGSVIYRKKAMAHLKNISKVIYLSIGLNTLVSRLGDMASRGVAIAPGRTIEDLYNERTLLYDHYSDIKIDCFTNSAKQVVKDVLHCVL